MPALMISHFSQCVILKQFKDTVLTRSTHIDDVNTAKQCTVYKSVDVLNTYVAIQTKVVTKSVWDKSEEKRRIKIQSYTLP